MKAFVMLRTYARLGAASIARVAVYRLGLKTGWHPVQRLKAPVALAPFFRMPEPQGKPPAANTAWNDVILRFGWHKQPLPQGCPDWFENPFARDKSVDPAKDWWRLSDFQFGDIKGIWELSRFDWVVAGATQSAQGNKAALDRMNQWLADWAGANPPYKGPNWKCGQEASIRVMHLITSAWILGQDQQPEQGLIDLITAHLQRIAPTMGYAIGQQNNHATSEAAALFIGGSILSGHDPRAARWAKLGRHWLEVCADKLIEPDGSFSQYSVNYHRVMLDTFSLAEAWRRHRDLPAFSGKLHARLRAATTWLWTITDKHSGDAPNIGANDGARLLPLSDSDYRDFRPSVQLAAALFLQADAYGKGPWTAALDWLGVSAGQSLGAKQSQSFDHGGFHVLQGRNAMAVLRYPRFRFRPSQADALHLDFWLGGVNLLRDAGTFSYNSDQSDWFNSAAAHNTITFDDHDQMPRLGKFLFDGWLSPDAVKLIAVHGADICAAAGYTDRFGARHQRSVTLGPNSLICKDEISGPFQRAHLRWRLAPGDWVAKDHGHSNGIAAIAIDIDGKRVSPTFETTPESRYYQHQSQVPLAMVTVTKPAIVTTKVTF